MAFYAWENWRSRKQTGWFYLMTVFAGAALSTKLSAVIALPIAMLGVVLQGETSPKKVLGQCFVLGLGVLIFILPWWGRNFVFHRKSFCSVFHDFFRWRKWNELGHHPIPATFPILFFLWNGAWHSGLFIITHQPDVFQPAAFPLNSMARSAYFIFFFFQPCLAFGGSQCLWS